MSLVWHQFRAEQLTFWRSREAAIFVFLFPPLLFVLLASVFGGGIEDGRSISSYLVAGLLGYAVANTALGGLAITLVLRRELGILKRLRSTPLPGGLYLGTVLLSNLVIVALQSLTVIALGVLLFDADLPELPLSFFAALMIGAVSFAGLGLAAAALIRSAEAVGDGTEDGRSISSYLVAGLLGYAVANTALGGLAITLVLRRELGILKRLRSTPLPGGLYLGTVLLSNLVIIALQSLAVVALGVLLFDADLPELPLSFAVALVIGAVAFAGLGLAAAALIRSAEAVGAVVNVIVLPMSFLSGAFGTTDNLPRVLELVADVLPLKYLIDLVLATYVDGEPITDHLGAIGVLAVWGAAGYLVARARFGWEPRER